MSTTQSTFKASIGSGTQYIHATMNGTSDGQPVSNSSDFTVVWGPMSLLSNLPLLETDGQWTPGSLTEEHDPSPWNLYPNSVSPNTLPQGATGTASAKYTSSISASGLVTTDETGSWSFTVGNSTFSGSESIHETIDLSGVTANGGVAKYTWHRTLNQTVAGNDSSFTDTETQDRTASLPVTVSPVSKDLRLQFNFDQQTISSGVLSVAVYQGTNPQAVYTKSYRASCDDAFPLQSGTAQIATVSTSHFSGLVFNINSLAGGSNQSDVELHVGSVGVYPEYSWDSQSCLVVSKDQFLDPLESFIANLPGSGIPDGYSDTDVENYLNAHSTMSLKTTVGLEQAKLGASITGPTIGDESGSFRFVLSPRSIEKEIKILYSVKDASTGQVLTTREAFIPAGANSTSAITAEMLKLPWSISAAGTPQNTGTIGWLEGVGPMPDPYISAPASDGLINSDAQTYRDTFGAPVSFNTNDKYVVGIGGYEVQYQHGNPTNRNNSPWYFDSNTGDNDLSDEQLMFSSVNQQVFSYSGAAPSSDVSVFDTLSQQPVSVTTSPYLGPVSGLRHQYIYSGPDNVNISVSGDNWFLHGGPGDDAIAAHGGYNVLDGGTGSNFLTGGTGTDTFFVDDRGPPADIWSTVTAFHGGDDVTVFGIVPAADGSNVQWFVDQGAAGYTGLTLHVPTPGHPTASLTLPGYSTSDLSNGRLSVQFGQELDGTPFMHIIANG